MVLLDPKVFTLNSLLENAKFLQNAGVLPLPVFHSPEFLNYYTFWFKKTTKEFLYWWITTFGGHNNLYFLIIDFEHFRKYLTAIRVSSSMNCNSVSWLIFRCAIFFLTVFKSSLYVFWKLLVNYLLYVANISYGMSSLFCFCIIIMFILQPKVWDTENLRNEF